MKLALLPFLAATGAFAAPVRHDKRYVPSIHVSAAASKRDAPVVHIKRNQNEERYVPSVYVSSAPKAGRPPGSHLQSTCNLPGLQFGLTAANYVMQIHERCSGHGR